MKLYEFGPTRSIRARWILQELGVDFDAVSIDLTQQEHCSPDFLELNPAGRVPVLIDGDFVLSESVAIVLYLAEKYHDRGFIPANLKLRADFYRWILFAVTELSSPGGGSPNTPISTPSRTVFRPRWPLPAATSRPWRRCSRST